MGGRFDRMGNNLDSFFDPKGKFSSVFGLNKPSDLGQGLFKKQVPDQPAYNPSTPTTTDVPKTSDTAVGEAAQRQRRQQATEGGRDSTILTKPLGLSEPAKTSKKRLLGA